MSRILSLYFLMGPSHVWEPAWGPRKNPSSLAKGATLKSTHSGRFFLSHFFMESCTFGVNMHKGTSTHLIGFSLRPANILHSLNTGAMRSKCFSLTIDIPMSSAQALTIPAFLERRALWNLVRKGSSALLKRKAEAGYPWRTPERKCTKVYVIPLWTNSALAFLWIALSWTNW